MLKISYDQLYNHPLKENHRFPMIKYELIPEQLILENTCNESNFFKPGLINEENILLTHDKIYYEKLKNQELNKKELRAIGFPMSEKLIQREKRMPAPTLPSPNACSPSQGNATPTMSKPTPLRVSETATARRPPRMA